MSVRRSRVTWGLAAAALLALAASAAGAQGRRVAGYARDEGDWRFQHHDRRVKVILLAGSIGAFQGLPYGRLLHQWCGNAEVQNLSRVGQGAPQLFSRFRNRVLSNPNVPIGAPGYELWLLFGGGMNSVGVPTRTNWALNRLFRLAHRRHFRVVALTLTPWGEDGSGDHRWQGARPLSTLRSTRRVVDYVMGRANPESALGRYRSHRQGVGPDDPWTPSELPEVAIDLYDSRLRDTDAALWTLDEARTRLESDARYRRELAPLATTAREERLGRDAEILRQAPRWFMAPRYRSFDHIHPNRAGHRLIAETACPQLPESWGCHCP